MKMSTKATDEPECESVAVAQLLESSVKLENTIKPSDEFLQIFKLLYAYSEKPDTSSKKQVKTMETKMKKLYDQIVSSENTSFDDIITLVYSYAILCYIYMCFDKKKDISTAKYFISYSLNLLKDKELHPKSILIALKLYYNLGYIFLVQQKFDKIIKSYDKAIQLYFTYTQENEYDAPIDFMDILKSSTHLNGYKKLHSLYINILETAVSICSEKVPTNMNYIIAYKHLLLTAQLSELRKTKQYYKWIKEALRSCYNLVKENHFAGARNYITTALSVKKLYVIEKCIKERIPSLDTMQKYYEITTFITEAWIKYGVNILRISAPRLLRLQSSTVNNDLKLKYPIKSFDEMKGGNPFQKIFDLSMMVKSISGYDDAHKVFVCTLCQFNNFKFSYDLIKEKIYLNFILDFSNAYKYMALYEKDINQILLQNRHVEILSEVVEKETHKEHPFMKRLRLQLAIGYSILIDAKLESLEEIDLVYIPQRHAIMCEIENLVEKALMNLIMYKQPVESQQVFQI